jgi:hypothetical protein
MKIKKRNIDKNDSTHTTLTQKNYLLEILNNILKTNDSLMRKDLIKSLENYVANVKKKKTLKKKSVKTSSFKS